MGSGPVLPVGVGYPNLMPACSLPVVTFAGRTGRFEDLGAEVVRP